MAQPAWIEGRIQQNLVRIAERAEWTAGNAGTPPRNNLRDTGSSGAQKGEVQQRKDKICRSLEVFKRLGEVLLRLPC
jgi:hypothetical protein